MSEERPTTGADETTGAISRPDSALTAPLLRFMPAITFGVRAAALAGMAASAGALAFGLAGAFDDSLPIAITTCCGDSIDAS